MSTRDTFDEFIVEADAAVAVWLDTLPAEAWGSRDLRMAAAFGELRALYQLYETWRESDGDASFSRVFDAYVAGRDALARRRNSLDFTGLLRRHMEHDEPGYEGGPDDAP